MTVIHNKENSSFYITEVAYCVGVDVFELLKIGTKLSLVVVNNLYYQKQLLFISKSQNLTGK